ncbi:MAG: hypothetical protein ACRD16_05845 [Thermoanaerobaculia bacterium]
MTAKARVSIVLFGVCAALYFSNGKTLAVRDGYDTLPSRVIPFSILRFHTLTLDPFRAEFEKYGRPGLSYLIPMNGHLLSYFPIGTALLAVPFYAPDYVRLRLQGSATPERLFWETRRLEKVTSVLIAALAVVALFHLLLMKVSLRRAAAISLVFGLATSVWSVASQMLWQHGPGVLCLTLGLFFLERASPPVLAAAAAGFCLGFATTIRPQSALFLLAGLAVIAVRKIPGARRLPPVAAFAAGAAAIGIVPLLYNIHYFGNLLGGYSENVPGFRLHYFAQGAPGLLLSPNRGLLVFTPIALLGILGVVWHLRRPGRDPVVTAFSIAAIPFFVAHSAFYNWTGGWTFGPRFLTELMPILALASTPLLPTIRRPTGIALGALVLWSFLVQADGAFCYPASNWNARMKNLEAHAWDFHHVQILEEFRAWKNQRRRSPAVVAPRKDLLEEHVKNDEKVPASHLLDLEL